MKNFARILLFVLVCILLLKLSGKLDTPFSKTNHDFDKTTLFIFNETNHNFAVKNGIEQKNLPPNQSHIFRLNKGEQILVGNEIIFLYKDAGYLDCEKDTFGQVSMLGGSFLKKYRVPRNIEFAMTIVPPGKGDRDNSRPATPEEIKALESRLKKIQDLQKRSLK